jgi:hypothetical protein
MYMPLVNSEEKLDAGARAFYRRGLTLLRDSSIPFLIGGSYAFERYTGIARDSKDLDLFVHPRDCERVFQTLALAGYQTDLIFPHWLGKAFCGNYFIDVIFSSGNGICTVDDEWFEHAVDAQMLEVSVRLCPPEEMIWQKAFIAERERYDGADIAHILKGCGKTLAWPRLLRRFDEHWRVLLSHIVLFGYIYPAERGRIPAWVMRYLIERLQDETRGIPPPDRLCQGTLLSRGQYLVDIMQWDYEDARLRPRGLLSSEEIAHFTAAIEDS